MPKTATSSALSLAAEAAASCPPSASGWSSSCPHCDPNVNLYDRIYACRGDKVEAIWPVAARRESTAG